MGLVAGAAATAMARFSTRRSGTLRSLQEVIRILDLDWGWVPTGTDPVQPIVAR
jgi:hypothetical protein